MRLAVITPVGPGHEKIAERAKASVLHAMPGPFASIRHIVIEDPHGELGRSTARNRGMALADADWLFFLDADDVMRPNACAFLDVRSPATFGAVSLDGKVSGDNLHPCDWSAIARRGASGTLSMGFFVRASLQMRFDETLDAGEDFEFYMRLPGFTKVRPALVDIGYGEPSAGGPRGYETIDWLHVCNLQILKAWRDDPAKFGVDCDALLEKARRTDAELDGLIREIQREARNRGRQ